MLKPQSHVSLTNFEDIYKITKYDYIAVMHCSFFHHYCIDDF